jgi:hypothetical protein
MAKVEVERLGGFAGFGGPGSRLRSRGSVDTSALPESDRKAVENLFAQPPSVADVTPDGFVYRLTQGTQTIEVPEQHVPGALKAAVKDRIE